MFVRGALPLREAVHSAFRCEQRVTADSAGGAPGAARSGGVQWVGSPFWPCVLSLHFIAQLRSTPRPHPQQPLPGSLECLGRPQQAQKGSDLG